MDLWEDPLEIDSSLHLPSKNDFIPCDFSIRAEKVSCHSVDALSPRCILDEPYMKLWYKLDTTFKLPRANTYFRITLKGGYSNIRNALLTELFILLLKDELNEIIYQVFSYSIFWLFLMILLYILGVIFDYIYCDCRPVLQN